jgi:uncharacterized peroxidase-related enzyme
MTSAPDEGFLQVPHATDAVQRLYDSDVEDLGYVMNASRVWAHQPATHDALFDLITQVCEAGGLTYRQRGILVTAMASTLNDSYCSLAWGKNLADEAGPDLAGSVLRGDDNGLEPPERALARWARQITRDPNSTGASDVAMLRDAGYRDAEIFAITAFVALRIAFSTVNDALGARPDRVLANTVPAPVRDAVTFGREPAAGDAP